MGLKWLQTTKHSKPYMTVVLLYRLWSRISMIRAELNVPGAPDEEPKGDGTQNPADSQAAVDKMAASAAPQQLAQQTATPKI